MSKYPIVVVVLGIACCSPGWAMQGSEAACGALSEKVAQAVELKQQGEEVDSVLVVLSGQGAPESITTEADAQYYDEQLPGAVRFAYMAGMRPERAAAYYHEQCMIGS